ncbi:MAG: hypothetical protein KJZ83_00335 [Burkholderiaceae bacterium]|nr:hypothetical protein [Burkholderiaceae bacterium]
MLRIAVALLSGLLSTGATFAGEVVTNKSDQFMYGCTTESQVSQFRQIVVEDKDNTAARIMLLRGMMGNGCLLIDRDDKITIIERYSKNFYRGRKHGFPDPVLIPVAYVEFMRNGSCEGEGCN